MVESTLRLTAVYFCPRCGQLLGGRDELSFCPRCGLPRPAQSAGRPVMPGGLVPPIPVAGFQYHQGPARWDKLNVGDALELILEPYNRHDPFAVAIYHEGRQIGHVPRQVSREIFKLVRNGIDLNPRIARKCSLRPFGYHSMLFQVDVPLGYNLWKWPT